MTRKIVKGVSVLEVPKNATLRQIYAIAKENFTADDLQKYAEDEPMIPAEQLLAQLEAICQKSCGNGRNGLATANGRKCFHVSFSAAIGHRTTSILRQALREGRGPVVLAAVRQIVDQLGRGPAAFGEVLYPLPILQMQLRSAAVPPLIAHFAVCKDPPRVLIKGVDWSPQPPFPRTMTASAQQRNGASILQVPKNATLRQIYAIVKKNFTAADLQKYFVDEPMVPFEQVIVEMEAIQKKAERQARRARNGSAGTGRKGKTVSSRRSRGRPGKDAPTSTAGRS